MSKDSDKAEPSMDDILASIRRIIDEDGSKTRKPAAGPAPGKAPADILELTEMVNDDGSVTTLQKTTPSTQPPQQTRMIDEEEPPIYADRNDRADQPPGFIAPEIIRPTLAGDPRPQPAQASMTERAMPPATSPPAQPPAPPPVQPPQQSRPQTPVTPTPPRVQATPSVTGSQFSLTPVSTNGAPGASPAAPGQGVSAAAAAFDRLAQAALQQQQAAAAPPPAPRAPSPTVGGRALEDMVGEMLRPMLQQWLDANLPAIVERLVQAEIQKMTKR